MISAKVVADSTNGYGNRLTTMEVVFPRIILAEFNTHRMLSKNSASSRAIPFEKMVKSVHETPFIPLAFQKDHKGMQGTEYYQDDSLPKAVWLEARNYAMTVATSMHNAKITKQLCNRLLEPFMYHKVIVSATEWENFFALRCPDYRSHAEPKRSHRSKRDYLKAYNMDANEISYGILDWLQLNKGQAEIHMMALAEAMWDAYNESIPNLLEFGDWHIPYREKITDLQIQQEVEGISSSFDCEEAAVKISTVMAARTSYTLVGQDQKPMTFGRAVELHDEMKNANPKHMSPFEHCGQAGNGDEVSGNFRGFKQYRKMIPNENITK